MKFFLVTYTSLVEASDEQAAAEKVVADIRSGRSVQVSVKIDEATVRHIAVDARPSRGGELTSDPSAVGTDNCLALKPDVSGEATADKVDARKWPGPAMLAMAFAATCAIMVVVCFSFRR